MKKELTELFTKIIPNRKAGTASYSK